MSPSPSVFLLPLAVGEGVLLADRSFLWSFWEGSPHLSDQRPPSPWTQSHMWVKTLPSLVLCTRSGNAFFRRINRRIICPMTLYCWNSVSCSLWRLDGFVFITRRHRNLVKHTLTWINTILRPLTDVSVNTIQIRKYSTYEEIFKLKEKHSTQGPTQDYYLERAPTPRRGRHPMYFLHFLKTPWN